MPMAKRSSVALLAGMLGPVLLLACSTSAQQQKKQGPSDAVATVGTTNVTLERVDEKALQEPTSSYGNLKLVQAVYEARRAAVDEIVGDMLLDEEAKRRGVQRAALVEQEITSHVAAVSEADVTAWYQANPQRVQGATIDQVRLPIQSLLTQERVQAAREAFLDKLKAKTPVRIMLEPPRQSVSAAGAPSRGPANAPIEMIEFADFQCPFCLAAAPTVQRVLDTYGDRIRFVYRNYPLPSHPNARPAAEAAQCANEQGKFWAYHDKLFADPGKLEDAQLKEAAASLGLDAARFNRCVDQHAYKSVVDADTQAANEVGVTGTPAFFINGRLLSGAQPYDAFKRVIEDELALKKK